MFSWKDNATKYLYASICLAYTGLFFDLSVSNVTLGILLVTCLVTFRFRDFADSLRSSIPVQLLIAFFLLHIIGVIYSENSANAWFVIEKKVTLLIMPLLVFPAISRFTSSERLNLSHTLGIITAVSGLVFLITAAFKQFVHGDVMAFHQDNFPSIPYVFYSIYFAVGSLMLLHSLYLRYEHSTYRIYILLSFVLYSLGMLVLIASKTGLIAFVTGLGYFLYLKVSPKKYFYLSAAGVLVSLAIFLVLYPSTLDRFRVLTHNLEILTKEKLTYEEEFTGLNLRLYFWKTSVVQLSEDNRLIGGVGTGDAQDFLDKAYSKAQLDFYEYKGFDAHSQWVMTLLQLGIIGVILLASVFVFGLISASKAGNLDWIFFTWIFFAFSFSESVLESNKGVVFFALFFCLLTLPGKKTS